MEKSVDGEGQLNSEEEYWRELIDIHAELKKLVSDEGYWTSDLS